MTRHRFSHVAIARHFLYDQEAVAAVEFALILPFLLVLLFGAVDLTDGVSARRKVTLVASTMSDLIGQVKDAKEGYVKNTFMAASAIMAPFDESRLTAVISSVVVDKDGKAKVVWSLSKNGQKAPRGKGTPFPLEAALSIPGSSLVVAEVGYDYKPVIGYAFTGVFNMFERAYAQPRVAPTGVTCSAPGC